MQEQKEDMITACDIDDTIIDLLTAGTTWLNNEYHYNICPEDITEWEIEKFYPNLTDDQVFRPLHLEEFWKTVKPLEDAIKYLSLLNEEGFTIYIVTSSSIHSLRYKQQFILNKYFPFISHKNIIVSHNKHLIRCSVLVDDAIHNISGPYIGLLKDSPHNRSFDKTTAEGTVYRVMNWKEVYEMIHKILEGMSK